MEYCTGNINSKRVSVMANLSDYDLFIVTQGLIDQDTNHRISVFKAVKHAETEICNYRF